MQTVDTLRLEFIGDTSDLDSSLAKTEKGLKGFGSVAQGVAMGAGIAIAGFALAGAKALGSLAASSIGAASDMNETIGKTNVLFGDSAAQLLAWGDAAATSLGQSKQQALDAATTFATFGRAAGLAGDDLVTFSTDFVTLATDLASFNNTSPEQAIQAIGAALRGESEPLRAYGVLLDDATMRTKALELGIIDNVKNALTPQQKVLAAQALIYEQTTAAQGDFERTSGGLANQQRILSAAFTDVQTVLGQALLPVMVELATATSGLVQKYLPELKTYINETVIPAVNGLVDSSKALLGEFQSTWPTLSSIVGITAGEVAANVEKIMTNLGLVSTWFSDSGEGGSSLKGNAISWAGVMVGATQIVADATKTVSTFLADLTANLASTGAALQAFGRGDFGEVMRLRDENAERMNQYSNPIGLFGQQGSIDKYFADLDAILQTKYPATPGAAQGFQNQSPQSGAHPPAQGFQNGQPGNGQTINGTFVPVAVYQNFYGTADSGTVKRAAADGVLEGLRATGR